MQKYFRLEHQAEEEMRSHSRRLAEDSAMLAMYDLAYADMKFAKDAHSAGVMFRDAERRIKAAQAYGLNVRELKKEADRVRSHLPRMELEGP